MRSTIIALGALLVAGLAVSTARAGFPFGCATCGRPATPVYYNGCYYGGYYTNPGYYPSYYFYPPGQPFNGFRPPLGPQGAQAGCGDQMGFPVHPFVRSPRDFFMWQDP
jgi:hypothetical protein